MAKRLRSSGKRAPASHKALAIETEPPQVSGLAVAQIQWHRTSMSWILDAHLRLQHVTTGQPILIATHSGSRMQGHTERSSR